MKTIFAAWLVFCNGYSVVRLAGIEMEENQYEYGACNVPMEHDYCHDGVWGVGETPTRAVLDCYRKAKLSGK